MRALQINLSLYHQNINQNIENVQINSVKQYHGSSSKEVISIKMYREEQDGTIM